MLVIGIIGILLFGVPIAVVILIVVILRRQDSGGNHHQLKEEVRKLREEIEELKRKP